MEPYGRYLNVVDVEATCRQGQAPPGEVSEIIEVGLCVVDLQLGVRVSRHRIVVRPARSEVSAFCTELTGLTQEEVTRGVGFAETCAIMRREHRSRSRPWASWGDYDRRQFERQCAAARVDYPFGSRHTNAKLRFTESFALPRRPGMADALRTAGLPLEGRHHRGEDDAWNIAALVLLLRERGDWPIDGPGAREEPACG